MPCRALCLCTACLEAADVHSGSTRRLSRLRSLAATLEDRHVKLSRRPSASCRGRCRVCRPSCARPPHNLSDAAYPARVPFAPGGAFDAIGRPWADKIKRCWARWWSKTSVVAALRYGAAAVARARPDGYTILLGGTQTHVNETLLKSRPLYDPVKDLVPIAGAAVYFLGIAVHPAVPAQNLNELIAYAKANPGKLSYGHAGVGTIQHLTGELFKSLARNIRHRAGTLSGTGPAITDLSPDKFLLASSV